MRMFTDDQLDILIKISKDNSSVKKRWEALANHPANLELKISRNDFLENRGLQQDSMERRIRNYIYLNKSIDYEKLRKSLDYTKDHPPPSLSNDNSGEFEIIDRRVKKLFVTIIIAAIVFAAYSFIKHLDEVSKANREYASQRVEEVNPIDQCVADSPYESACRADPVFTYCGIAVPNILGSGCTSRIKNAGGPQAQADMCIAELKPIIREQCAIEILGCTVVTGQIGC